MSPATDRKEIYLPPLRYFENKHSFSGSSGLLRFMLKPDLEASSIHVQIWHGILCLQKSTVEQERDFPLTAEGRAALQTYLEENQ